MSNTYSIAGISWFLAVSNAAKERKRAVNTKQTLFILFWKQCHLLSWLNLPFPPLKWATHLYFLTLKPRLWVFTHRFLPPLQLDSTIPCGALSGPPLMIGNTSRDHFSGGRGGREAPERARHRCRGFWHTLAAEWFQLRISVITFRSVIYSWPLAATHDPHSPGDLIKGGGGGCANTAISELQWIYCLLLLSCLSPSCVADTRKERGFILQDLALPAWIYSPDRDPTNDTPAIPSRPPLSSTPAVYLWNLEHTCAVARPTNLMLG